MRFRDAGPMRRIVPAGEAVGHDADEIAGVERFRKNCACAHAGRDRKHSSIVYMCRQHDQTGTQTRTTLLDVFEKKNLLAGSLHGNGRSEMTPAPGE